MKSVLFSTDFVRRSDGTLTPVEINTNTGHLIHAGKKESVIEENFEENLEGFMDYVALNNFMIENNLNKIITIGGIKFKRIFTKFCQIYGFEFEDVVVQRDSVIVPEVQESENELVIRIAYDSYSIFDDLYARDMFEFHNLIKDEPFASPVTFLGEDELDTINELELSIDGVVPNYVIKPRFPAYNKQEYPKLYRFENDEKLNNVKSNLTSNEFIQKYEINPSHVEENGNTVYFYRSIDLLINNTFDILNIFSYKEFNSVNTDNDIIVYDYETDENQKMNDAMAIKYYPTWYVRDGFHYHFDDTDKILLQNNELVNSTDIKVNDVLKSIRWDDDIVLIENKNESILLENLNNFEQLQSVVDSFSENGEKSLFVNITAVNTQFGEFKWYDGYSNHYFISKKDETTVSFISFKASEIEIGDTVYIYDNSISQLIPFTVTNLFFDIKQNKTYKMSLNPSERFFIQITNENHTEVSSNLYLLQHNSQCRFFCYEGTPYWACYDYQCSNCRKNDTNCLNCGSGGGSYFCS